MLRAIELTTQLTDSSLREAHACAILAVLSEAMLAWLREVKMDASKIPQSAAVRSFRRFLNEEGRLEGKIEGRVEGKQEALLAVLTARGLPPADEDQARITACISAAELDRWIKRAATAASIGEVFAPARTAPTSPARRAPAKARARAPERTAHKATKPARTS